MIPSWLESGCDSSSSGGQSFPGAFLVGMAASVSSSIGSSFGCVLQKKAHAQNEQRIADSQPSYTVFAGIMLSPLWITGFVLLVLLPLPFDFISLALAPASLITPLGGVTIIAYPLGLVIVLFGIYILTWQQPTQVADGDIQEDAKAASKTDERSKSSPDVQLRGRPRLALPASPYTAALQSESTPIDSSLPCSPITISVAEEKEKNSNQVTDVQAAGVNDLETPPCRANKLPPLD